MSAILNRILMGASKYGDEAVKFAKGLFDDGATVTQINREVARKFAGSGGKTPSRFPAGRPQLKASRPSLAAATKVVKPRAKPGGVNKGADAPKLSKPTAGPGRAVVKAQTPAIQATRPALKATRPALAATTKVVKPRAKPGGINKGATPKPLARTKIKPAVTPKPKSNVGKGAAATGAATAATILAMLQAQKKKASGDMPKTLPKSKPAKPAKPKKASPGGTNKGADPKKAMPKAGSGPATRGSAKRGATKIITASKNTGFGPKGNIFPGNAEERKALMKMYGGTGSAAGKAAIAGKQGNIAAGRADYEAARRKRLKAATTNKKSGKKVVPNKMKGFSKLPEKVQRKMSPTKAAKYKYGGSVSSGCARQVKGFGAARRPKK